jgi:AcrR family transcriptional regulator
MSARKSRPGRRHLVRVARGLFERDGVHATGVDRIAEVAGVTKRTLYYHFGSKDELLVEALREPSSRPLPDTGRGPRADLLALYDGLGEWFSKATFRGCPYVNAVAETGGNHPARLAALESKERRFNWLRERLQSAGARDPDEAAAAFQLLYEGAVATAVIRRGAAAAKTARAMAEVLLASYGVEA